MNITDFHRKLSGWYRLHGRKALPWRNTDDAYAIWISEVMLQQTQVKTVLERYYFPFLQKFPTITDLANAPRDAVLKAWEGLGYYNRAANLHKAAGLACNGLPDNVDALLALPGIGRNTANAVASFAFRREVPVMEANVKRILCRVFVLENPSADILWEKAVMLLDRQNAFDYNQAMMDIGAMVCTPRAPQCSECPANSICAGKARPEHYPAPKSRKQVPVRHSTITVCRNADGAYYLRKREGTFLQGLYGFEAFAGGQNSKPVKIGEVTQTYSHFKAMADVVFSDITFSVAVGEHWYSNQDISKLALSGIDSKVWKLVQKTP